MFRPTIIVHGGARQFTPDTRDLVQEGVKAAARQGYAELTKGGSAMDAVVAAVSAMEDNTVFNAGFFLISISGLKIPEWSFLRN